MNFDVELYQKNWKTVLKSKLFPVLISIGENYLIHSQIILKVL